LSLKKQRSASSKKVILETFDLNYRQNKIPGIHEMINTEKIVSGLRNFANFFMVIQLKFALLRKNHE